MTRPLGPTVLVLGAIAAAVIAAVAALVGQLVAAGPGLISGLVGSALALPLLGVTAIGLLVAARLVRGGTDAYLEVLVAGWLVKFAVFLVVVLSLRGQPWLVPGILFVSVVATLLASVAVDVRAADAGRPDRDGPTTEERSA